MTTYVVIRRVSGDAREAPRFEACGQVEAHGALAALRQAGEKWGEGRYVAVPKSNWTEESVGVQTTTRITVGGATANPEPEPAA